VITPQLSCTVSTFVSFLSSLRTCVLISVFSPKDMQPIDGARALPSVAVAGLVSHFIDLRTIDGRFLRHSTRPRVISACSTITTKAFSLYKKPSESIHTELLRSFDFYFLKSYPARPLWDTFQNAVLLDCILREGNEENGHACKRMVCKLISRSRYGSCAPVLLISTVACSSVKYYY
jgi:hypothetical protein